LSLDALFSPLSIRSLQLKNRIVMAPMTRSFSPGGAPGKDVAAYYQRRAAGGAGLIVTEGTAIERPAAKNDPRVPDFFGRALEGWSEVVTGVHSAGARIAPQLWHVGATPDQRSAAWTRTPIDSPSGLAPSGAQDGEPMSEEAIADTIHAFARAAAAARKLGFDALELHGAHGYLIDQFLWSRVNVRPDTWGGDTLAQRARFGAEVVKAVRAQLGDDRPLILRLSQWKIRNYDIKLAATPEEMRAWLEPLAAAGVDVFHCSQRRFWEAEFPGSDLNFAGWARKLTGKPTIAVGSIGLDAPEGAAVGVSSWSINEAARRVERGEFDLIAVGRAMIATPDWANKVREHRLDELDAFDSIQLKSLT
jgi:2,4-dienoyl-CoA reductase-like NADH-dependent reductase (Old Yellow Enzyme family)